MLLNGVRTVYCQESGGMIMYHNTGVMVQYIAML